MEGGEWVIYLPDPIRLIPTIPDVGQDGENGVRLTLSGPTLVDGEPALPMCPADFNGDGGIDGADVDAFFLAWEGGDAAADVNLDGGVDGSDVELFLGVWEQGGCN